MSPSIPTGSATVTWRFSAAPRLAANGPITCANTGSASEREYTRRVAVGRWVPGQAAGPDPDAVGHLNMSELALVLLQRLLARARAGFAGSSHSEGQYRQRHGRLYHRPGGAVDSGQAV